MNLFNAIIETMREWGELLKRLIGFLKDRRNLKGIAKIIWLIWPIFIILYIGCSNFVGVAVTDTFLFVVLAFSFYVLWFLFWMGVYDNLEVKGAYRYDEEKEEWVTEYEDKGKG